MHRTMYCLNLKERSDRWEQTQTEFRKLGSEYTLHRYEAIPNADMPWVGHSQTFVNIVRMAKEKSLPAVLIGEDDLVLCSRSKEVWEQGFKDLPDDWDVYSGGAYLVTERKPITETLSKVGCFCSTHFILIRNTIYDKIIEHATRHGSYVPKPKFTIKRKPSLNQRMRSRNRKKRLIRRITSRHGKGPSREPDWSKNRIQKFMDRYMGWLSENGKLNCYLTWPMVSSQRAGFSNIQNREVDVNEENELRGLVFLPGLVTRHDSVSPSPPTPQVQE